LSELLNAEIRDKPLVVGVSKAKVLLDCSHDQIYDLLRAGELASYLERNRRKITMASIEALIAKRLAATGGELRLSEKSNLPRKQNVAA
jgi:hypothetical protein